MLIFFIVESEDEDLGYMDSNVVPRAGEFLQLIPMPVPLTGTPERHEDFRVVSAVHMIGEEDAHALVHAGVTVFLERMLP